MKLSIRGFAFAVAIIRDPGNVAGKPRQLLSPGYAMEFLAAIGSLYPGFEPGFGVKSIVVGTHYGIAAAIFA